MHFAFSDDQLLFREAIRELLTNECTAVKLRTAWESDRGRIEGLWPQLANVGLVGLTAPEIAGGLGMNDVDLVLLLEQTGVVALPEPLIEHTAIAVPTIASAGLDDHRELLEAAASGEQLIAVSTDAAPFVLYADQSDYLLIERDDQLVLGEIDGVELTARPSVDGSRRLFSVDTGPGWGTPLDADADLLFDRGATATAAQALGVAQYLLDATVEYVSEREQFGKAVGTYQAVKHHLADVALRIEFARPCVYNAAWAVANRSPHRSRDVSLAKALASEAVDLACREALQCHGAIAYTYEYDLQMWMKRGWALAAAWGDSAWHRNRVGAALGI